MKRFSLSVLLILVTNLSLAASSVTLSDEDAVEISALLQNVTPPDIKVDPEYDRLKHIRSLLDFGAISFVCHTQADHERTIRSDCRIHIKPELSNSQSDVVMLPNNVAVVKIYDSLLAQKIIQYLGNTTYMSQERVILSMPNQTKTQEQFQEMYKFKLEISDSVISRPDNLYLTIVAVLD